MLSYMNWETISVPDTPNWFSRINHIIHFRTTGSLIRSDFFFQFTTLCKQQTNALKILHGFTDSVIQERRKKLVNQRNESSDDTTPVDTNTFLDILLQGRIDGKPLSNLDIREEVDTFMFEVGLDTLTIFYCSNKKRCSFHRAMILPNLQSRFACILWAGIHMFNRNVSKKSEMFLEMIARNQWRLTIWITCHI